MSEKRAQQALIEQFRLLMQPATDDQPNVRAAVARSLRVLSQVKAGGPRPAALAQWGRLPLPTADVGLAIPEFSKIPALTDPLPTTVSLANRTVKSSELLGRIAVELCSAALTQDPAPLHKPALTQAVRFVVSLLAATYVGRSIEVRVPPVAACQCGLPESGPVHTRGTPPNVVETDAQTFLSLATGRLSWAQARAEYAVRASGSRADLSAMLPVVDAG